MVDDRSIKFKSMFIDMDLALHQSLNSPRARKPQKSLGSHEEFEFSMSHVPIKDQAFEHLGHLEVASADRLFFKGQILPLHQEPKRPMGCPKSEEGYSSTGNSSYTHDRDNLSLHASNQRSSGFLAIPEKSLSQERTIAKGSFSLSCNEGIYTLPLNYFQCQGGSLLAPLKFANEEENSLKSRDGIDPVKSCRVDGTFDILRNDSCSSSFRSHYGTSYWSSAEKDSRDSIGSSKCSFGSYQDSYCAQGNEKLKLASDNISMQLKETSHPSTISSNLDQRELSNIMGEFSLNANPSHGRNHAKPPIPRSGSRRWSWKGLLTGLKKASKFWVDDERGADIRRQSDTASKDETEDLPKGAVFTFKQLPDVLGESTGAYRRSVGHDREWQANSYQFVSREGSTKIPGKGWGLGVRDDCEYQQVGAIYCLRSGGRQEAAVSNCFTGNAGEMAVKRECKGKLQGNVWNRCVDRVKKGSTKLSVSAYCRLVQHKDLESNMSKNANIDINEEDKMGIYRMMKTKSLSSTPLTKSPVRTTAEHGNLISMSSLNESFGGFSLYTMQGGAGLIAAPVSTSMKGSNKKLGFAASCPASMRSSPHHSGLLAVVNKPTPDLHTAIQGAIAHCKQSQIAAENQETGVRG